MSTALPQTPAPAMAPALHTVHFSLVAAPLTGLGDLRHRHNHSFDRDDPFNTKGDATAQAGRFRMFSPAIEVCFYFIWFFFILIMLS